MKDKPEGYKRVKAALIETRERIARRMLKKKKEGKKK